MLPVQSTEVVRLLDAAAVAGGTSIEQLMERAGWAVAREARAMLGGCYGRRIVVVCGKGNNGGDGLVAARLLAADGARACVVLLDAPSSEATAKNLARHPGPIRGAEALADEVARADLVIDAIVGVGVVGALRPDAQAAVDIINGARMVLAVDIPSGVDADTGRVVGAAVRATRTVAIGGLKPGLLFEPGRSNAGTVSVADIGLDPTMATAFALDVADVAEQIPLRRSDAHKRSVGTALVVAGSDAMPGAAALVTGAAIHAGAGLTRLCSTTRGIEVALSLFPEATAIPVATTEGVLDLDALGLVADIAAHSLVIGPGLGTSKATAEFVRRVIAETPAPVIVDADGLTAIAGAPEVIRGRRAPTVLTPHAGELARLLDADVAEVDADRIAAARNAAHRFGCIVVFKGPGTVIAGPNGTFVTRPGGPALSQGGTGDVLAGLLAGWIAQRARQGGAIDERTVAAAVWVHARAGDLLAERLWPHPANASALVEQIGPTMHAVMNS